MILDQFDKKWIKIILFANMCKKIKILIAPSFITGKIMVKLHKMQIFTFYCFCLFLWTPSFEGIRYPYWDFAYVRGWRRW